jgi:Uncharacterized conserved protein (DUF2190)
MRTIVKMLFALGAAVMMANAEQIARFKPGVSVSVYAKKTLEAGRLVKVVGRRSDGVYEAEHADKEMKSLPFGVTQRGAAEGLPEKAQDRLVEVVRRGAVARIEAGAEVKAGELVEVSTGGVVIPQDAEAKKGIAVGRALSTAKKEEFAEVDLF